MPQNTQHDGVNDNGLEKYLTAEYGALGTPTRDAYEKGEREKFLAQGATQADLTAAFGHHYDVADDEEGELEEA